MKEKILVELKENKKKILIIMLALLLIVYILNELTLYTKIIDEVINIILIPELFILFLLIMELFNKKRTRIVKRLLIAYILIIFFIPVFKKGETVVYSSEYSQFGMPNDTAMKSHTRISYKNIYCITIYNWSKIKHI